MAATSSHDMAGESRFRDYSIFLRLGILDRIGTPPLPPEAVQRLSELELAYPNWRIAAGDSSSWVWISEDHGIAAEDSAINLGRLSAQRLLAILRASDHERGDLLDTWEHLMRTRPGRGIGVLCMLALQPSINDRKIWQETLFGLRDAIARPAVARRVFAVLAQIEGPILQTSEFLSPASDLIELAARQKTALVDDVIFFRVWDYLLEGALSGKDHEKPDDDDSLTIGIEPTHWASHDRSARSFVQARVTDRARFAAGYPATITTNSSWANPQFTG